MSNKPEYCDYNCHKDVHYEFELPSQKTIKWGKEKRNK